MEKKVKKIGFRHVLAWVLGILFIVSGAMSLKDSFLGGLLIIIASIIIIPPFADFIEKKFSIRLSGWLLFIAFLILIGLGVSMTTTSMKKSIAVQPTENVQKDIGSKTETETQETETQPKKKVKSATLSIDRVQIQVANLYPTRVTVTNTGDVSISPKFDLYVYDRNNKEVCSGSPMFDEMRTLSSGEKQTGEVSIMGCMFEKDGTYTLKIDLLDSDYSKLDTQTKDFEVEYWSKFQI